ncbi:MAG: PD40 domain-containing protein [Flavobacteriales bacterium]|nr:PD40 domain-containing protein [Flavobacteriales bacterium]
MKKYFLFTSLLFLELSLFSQDKFRERFYEANTMMEERYYEAALPIWLNLLEQQPDNNNLNYKVGVCYINTGNQKRKALQYLEKAIQNTTSNYDIFSHTEKKAPVETHYYYARALHLNMEFDKAIEHYKNFKTYITKKHYLWDETDMEVKRTEYAKIAVANPVNLKVQNLGPKINTIYPEYSPVISIDESAIYFTSRRVRPDSSNANIIDEEDGLPFEDIYVSFFEKGEWQEPELLTLNSMGHEATLNITIDGNTLLIYKDDNGNGELYKSFFDGEMWNTPEKLSANVNSTSYETHAALSPDNSILYFVSDRKGGLGGKDIYMCKKLPNGEWALAQNLGPNINTLYDEDGIFLHPDGKTLYFSSRGHTSIGGYDIFYSELQEDGSWSTPANMGYPVNSTDDDIFFVTSVDGRRAYYSSFQDGGYGEKDIYMITLMDAPEKALTLLTGIITVIGMDKLPEDALITITNNETGELIGKYKPRARDGRFSIILQPGNEYHIKYEAAGFSEEEDLYIPPASAYQEIDKAIGLKPVVFGSLPNKDKDTTKDKDTGKDVTSKDKDISKDKDTGKDITSKDNNKDKDTGKDLTSKDKNTGKDTSKDKDGTVKDQNTDKNTTTDNKEIDKSKVIFQKYFGYNVKDINKTDKLYADFINKLTQVIEKEGSVKINIESSASKVPTKTFVTNENLAEKRALEAKLLLFISLKEKGIKSDQVIINNIVHLVQGPEYINDAGNQKKYQKFQYVKLTIE